MRQTFGVPIGEIAHDIKHGIRNIGADCRGMMKE
jgi:hypothetical protein